MWKSIRVVLVALLLLGIAEGRGEERFRCEIYCTTEWHNQSGACSECSLPLRNESFFAEKLASGKTAVVLLFPGVQVIDFSGPFEVLGAAGIRVRTVAKKPGLLRTDEGLAVVPDFTFEDCPPADLIVVPGGKIYPDETTEEWLRKSSEQAEIVLSVCNGLAWLDAAGLIEGKECTTNAVALARLADSQASVKLRTDRKVIDTGKIISTGGYTCGIDGALQVVSRWKGLGAAKLLAAKLEYDWQPDRGAFPRYRSYYQHLRSLVRRLQRTAPVLAKTVMTDALVEGGRGSVTWSVALPENKDETVLELREALGGLADLEGRTVEEDALGSVVEWPLSSSSALEWRARGKLRLNEGANEVVIVLEVTASPSSSEQE